MTQTVLLCVYRLQLRRQFEVVERDEQRRRARLAEGELEHFGVFGGSNRHGCKVKIRDFESLAVSLCGCEGYVAASGPLAQAAFAADEARLADAVMPTLRIVNPPHTN